jgi:hypothetical protein
MSVRHHDLGRQHRHRRAAGITAFSLRPPRMPPAISSSFANGVPSGIS